jgi:MFS family permease
MKINSKYKWVVLIIFFAFMLLHQTDKLLIKPLAPQIYKEWKLTDTQWGVISTAPLIVGAVFYPVWGYLYDRYARSKLLALAPSSGGQPPGSALLCHLMGFFWLPALQPALTILPIPACTA